MSTAAISKKTADLPRAEGRDMMWTFLAGPSSNRLWDVTPGVHLASTELALLAAWRETEVRLERELSNGCGPH